MAVKSNDSKLITENKELRDKIIELEHKMTRMKNEISSILNKW